MTPGLRFALEGRWVRLEPLSLGHVDALAEVAFDPELWEWTPQRLRSAADLEAYVRQALAERDAGRAAPFATVDRSSGRPVGSTRFGSIALEHRRVEIGWTWLGVRHQRTALNTEAKLLMFEHAFGVWGCQRVELKTDALNERSRRAIERVGGQYEGQLRQHVVCESGRVRDTVYYSVVASEWPTVREVLQERLRRGAPRGTS